MENNIPVKSSSALVLFSGGQDSTVALYWALKNFDSVSAIAFDYGQRNIVELECAQKIADIAGVTLEIVDIQGVLIGSSLIDHSASLMGGHERDAKRPAAFTPGRNMLFLTIAANRAYKYGINNLVTGVIDIYQTETTGYPDSRINFIESCEITLGIALGERIKIHIPFASNTKAETWKIAKEYGILDIVRDMTHTGYSNDRSIKNDWGYGIEDNPSSILRAKEYRKAVEMGWV